MVPRDVESQPSSTTYGMPIVLSAKSQRSLRDNMSAMLRFLESDPGIDMADLAWTLMRKQAVLPVRHAIPSHTREGACLALQAAIKENLGVESSSNRGNKGPPQILGIFTGQGVQWPGMCKSLLASIPWTREIIDELDASLQTLPTAYRPIWTLRQRLCCDGVESQPTEARFSQPLCAAVQLVLLRLLEAAGIKFTTIVGHSSGEIVCAAAARYITPFQAIRIAYLRGLAVTTSDAEPPDGARGAMLAAEITHEDAEELCSLEDFEGRICVAAYNAPTSVTISGDADALQHVEAILKDEGKFTRFLRVDKAYHSHHMAQFSDAYTKSLVECGCAANPASKTPDPSSPVAWYSSVYEGRLLNCTDITAEYWAANLVSPVRFSQAVERAVSEYHVAYGVEVGAHPALKRPTTATIQAISGTDLPYTGCMKRSQDDTDAFAEALAYLWEPFSSFNIPNADSFMRTVSPSSWPRRSLTKVIPRYSWDHTRSHWTETRATKAFLAGPAPHLLLGSLLPTSTDSTFQWQSFIKPQDDKWLEGHDLQGQPILPAAGYVAMAMEAALHVTRKRVAQDVKVTVLEVLDLSIDKAISFDDKNSMAELLVTLKVTHQSAEQLEAEVHIDSALDRETKPSNSANGRVVATFGSPSMCLPRRGLNEPLHPNHIDISSFYRELELLGLDYTKKYRGVHELRRADGRAAGRLSQYRLGNSSEQGILLHPATLDAAFQAIMGAFSYPGDKALRSTVVPVHIDRIALVPGACASALGSHDEVSMRFNATCSSFKDSILSGDVEVFDDNSAILFQVDNIVLQPLYKPDLSSDHLMFTKTVWGPYSPDRILDRPEFWATAEDKRMIPIIERIVYHYVKDFLNTLTQEDRQNASPGLQKYIHWNEQVLEKAREWKTTFYEPNWEMDTSADVQKLCEENWCHPYVRLVKRVSENAISTIRDNTNPFHWMNADGLLSEFYASPLSAGTGSATRYVLNIPQLGFNSYTFTDISGTFFDKAREVFSQHKDRMDFRKLDITRNPAEQGFTPHSYDLVIASSVLHATPRLVDTMTNVRSLLKPGGHVVIAEATFKEYLRTSYIFGLFPDWWAGYEEGRVLDPFASYEEWDSILKRSGFSGIDSRTSDRESWVFQNSLFSAHAINPKVQRLDSPLLKVPNGQNHGADMPQLVFIGGLSDRSSALLGKLQDTLTHRRILRLDCLKTIPEQEARLETGSTFIVVSELDDEMFDKLNDVKLEAAKSLLSGDYAKVIVWITEAAFTHNPRQAMTIGLLRTIQLENPQINVLNIDVDDAEHSDYPALIAEHVTQLEETTRPPEDSSGLLWSHEPEMYIVDGRTWIPRIKHDAARNNRLNSARRVILSDARPSDTPVRLRLCDDGASSYLESMDTLVSPRSSSALPGLVSGMHDDPVHVRVHFALTGAIRVGRLGFFHLCQGLVTETKTPVVVLADSNASIVRIPRSRIFALPSEDKCILHHVVASVISHGIMSSAVPDTTVLVFDAPRFCVDAIAKQAKERSIEVRFATSQQITEAELSSGFSWTYLEPWVSERTLKKMMTAKVSIYCDFSSATEHTSANLGRRLAKIQTPHCAKDLSNEKDLDAGLFRIRETLPPIGGIAYGPLVLRDTMLQNMSLADMNLVLDSKVVGARLLHERFCDARKETPLDFFIMFSSGATVGGNPGQSNYNAANAYLQALAQYRRAKGLVASTIHVGAVMGIGYLARTHFDEQLLKVHDMGKLGEKDFHTLFAEAIVSGRCALGQEESNTNRMSVTDMSDIEVITGFPVFEAKNKNSFKLWDNPRFGHLRTSENSLSHVGEGSLASRVSIKERLREATTVDEAKEAIIRQKYVWKLQQLLSHDRTIFHNTIAYFFEGYIDLQRLGTAVDEVIRRHEILRTAFLANPEPDTGDDAFQVVLEKPTWGLKCTSVANQAAAREAMKQLHEEPYDLESGRPFKIVDFHWSSARRHLLVIAYHRLAGDGATTSILLSEVSALYDGAVLPATVPQFSKITMRQRAEYEQGRLDADIAYWISQYNNNNAVPVMPVLGLPHCRFLERSNGPPSSWSQHTGVFRLSSAVSAQVKQAVRQQKVSRMQLFMAVYAALLARLTTKISSSEAVATKNDYNDNDARTITIGIADTNRATMEEMAAMGFFANYLPVRIKTREKEGMSPLSPFEQLGVIKKAMRGAMQHARLPYSVLLERLPVVPSLEMTPKDWPHAPLFQAVFDYAGGGIESVHIGDAVITEQGGLQASELVSRERTPYDVVLEIWDDATRDPLVIVKLQSSLYGSEDVTVFYNAFVELLAAYSADLMSHRA
ncbi:Lovastatin nonaketide synthase [Colletotrichum sp. SAR11_57]|nr:Lovastatin nonaketide synthase [Colletotrichum sp. SAR11_57]